MREIKFRGITKIDKRMVYGHTIQDNRDNTYVLGKVYIFSDAPEVLYSPEFYEVDSATVGKYTGLKDKNGNDIYEGDTLKATYTEGGVEYECYLPVLWSDEEAAFIVDVSFLNDKEPTDLLSDWTQSEREINGNIYNI